MRRERLKAMAALGLAWAVFFAAHLASNGVPYYRDHLMTNVPLRDYMRQRLLSGELPQWLPYEGLGVPLVGQIALGVFHPFNFLFLPLSAPYGEKWALLGSYLLALCGAYRLSRELGASRAGAILGGVAYAFGGYALGVSSIMAYAMSAAALPWTAWAALRAGRRRRAKDAALLAVLWALVFLAGDAIGFLLCGAFALWALLDAGSPREARARAPALALGAVLAALLACIELVPALSVAREALRNVGQPSAQIGFHWALHPLRIPELFAAGWIPDPVRNRVVGQVMGGAPNVFATSIFAGATVLLLAASGLQRRRLVIGLAVLGALGFWLALGDYGLLLRGLRFAIPLFRRFRYPERYLAFFFLALAALAALGFDRARASPRRFAAGAGLWAIALGALAALAAAGWLPHLVWWMAGKPLADPAVEDAVRASWSSGLAWSAVLAGAVAALLLASERRRSLAALIPLVVFAELWRGNGEQLPLVDPELMTSPNAFVEVVRSSSPEGVLPLRALDELEPFYPSTVTGPERELWVVGIGHFLRATASTLQRVPAMNSNLGALQLRHAMVFGTGDQRLAAAGPLFGGCFHVARLDRPLAPGESVEAKAPPLGIELLRAPCRDRAYLSGAVGASSREEALRRRDLFDLRADRVVWEGGPDLAPAQGTVRFAEDAPERIALEVEASGPSALVLSDDYAPGWTAALDGAEVPIHPALVTARGVEVPAGKHRVEFRYRTPALGAAIALSLAGALGCLLAWAITGARERKARRAASSV